MTTLDPHKKKHLEDYLSRLRAQKHLEQLRKAIKLAGCEAEVAKALSVMDVVEE